jgi:GT2 family glycosyltransferase
LAGALESIAVSQVPSSVTWEVLVVDNNSTDRTREIAEDFCRRYPERFRYVFVPKPGKSHALNTGIASAGGEILVFVDDDVKVEPTWLQNLTAELLRDGEWAGAGGRTLPAQKFRPPAWVPEGFEKDWSGIVFAHFDLGDNAGELDRAPYGTNMAFRKSMFEKHGGFRIDLGPAPGSQIRNEDTELGRRLLAAGERLRYEPSAVVYHPVPDGRITQKYFLSWWFDYGRARVREFGVWPDVYGIPRDYLRLSRAAIGMPVLTLRWLLAIQSMKTRFLYKCWLWKEAGQIVELYRRSIRSQKK